MNKATTILNLFLLRKRAQKLHNVIRKTIYKSQQQYNLSCLLRGSSKQQRNEFHVSRI